MSSSNILGYFSRHNSLSSSSSSTSSAPRTTPVTTSAERNNMDVDTHNSTTMGGDGGTTTIAESSSVNTLNKIPPKTPTTTDQTTTSILSSMGKNKHVVEALAGGDATHQIDTTTTVHNASADGTIFGTTTATSGCIPSRSVVLQSGLDLPMVDRVVATTPMGRPILHNPYSKKTPTSTLQQQPLNNNLDHLSTSSTTTPNHPRERMVDRDSSTDCSEYGAISATAGGFDSLSEDDNGEEVSRVVTTSKKRSSPSTVLTDLHGRSSKKAAMDVATDVAATFSPWNGSSPSGLGSEANEFPCPRISLFRKSNTLELSPPGVHQEEMHSNAAHAAQEMDSTSADSAVSGTSSRPGRLRVRKGINFEWHGDVVDTNHNLGRAYYSGFILQNKSFSVGEEVTMRTEYVTQAKYIIVAVFQATKSFAGMPEGYTKHCEIQKRGHPYMEVAAVGSTQSEVLPDWLLDATLVISKVARHNGEIPIPPREQWSENLIPYRVFYYKHRKPRPSKVPHKVLVEYHPDSGDDSDSDRADYGNVRSECYDGEDNESLQTLEVESYSEDTEPRLGDWGDNRRAWDSRFKELEEYKEENGHCNVPQRESALGRWVANQRKQYKLLQKQKNSCLTPYRQKALNSIGFSWDLGRGRGFDPPSSSMVAAGIRTEEEDEEDSDEDTSDSAEQARDLKQSFTRKARGPALQLVLHTKANALFSKREPRNGEAEVALEHFCDTVVTTLYPRSGKEVTLHLKQRFREEWQMNHDTSENPPFDIAVEDEGAVDAALENIRAKFYDGPFRPLQHRVCKELLSGRMGSSASTCRSSAKNDVFFLAPCGSGKTLCFVVASQVLGGITLVVEPLRSLIQNQKMQLLAKGIDVKVLLNVSDTRTQSAESSDSVFHELANRNAGCDPLILFATPEILMTGSSRNGLNILVSRNLLSLIVIDEFDSMDEGSDNYRPEYRGIVAHLKNTVNPVHATSATVPFLFLSATGSAGLIHEILADRTPPQNNGRPIVCFSPRALPSNLTYSVEAKGPRLQDTVDRMVTILHCHTKDKKNLSSRDLRCICYCLTRANCEKVAKYFGARGIQAEILTSTQNPSEIGLILTRFHQGIIQVICATKALGRGVHFECPIQFIFHVCMPISINDYIQETGRGGRDGTPCHCILFYRNQDRARALRVTDYSRISEIDNVCKYAVEGLKCRTSMLAGYAIADITRAEQSCLPTGLCDNCKYRMYQTEEEDISYDVVSLLQSVQLPEQLMDLLPRSKEKNVSRLDREVLEALFRHLSLPSHFGRTHSSHDARKPFDISKMQQGKWIDCLKSNDVTVHLRNHNQGQPMRRGVHLFAPQKKCERAREQQSAVFDVEDTRCSRVPPLLVPRFQGSYLVNFESERLCRAISDTEGATSVAEACECLHRSAGQKPAAYIHRLKELEDGEGISLFYSASLNIQHGKLSLNEPDKAFDRRIYRMYGSDRFLAVSVGSDVTHKQAIKFFVDDAPINIGGRLFNLLWCKKHKNPQTFVLFAEKGCGIPPANECCAGDVIRRCVPPVQNPQLTLGQLVKRLKLNFSGTAPGAKLPPGSVVILDADEIDGSGLISRQALDDVYAAYNGRKSQVGPCPHSGFQGRLSGFKGVWILDSTLEGYEVQCRPSQMKYKAPMTCIDSELPEVDPIYETFDICSFCVPLGAKLDTRLIQMLEYHARRSGKIAQLWEFLRKCMLATVEGFKELSDGDVKALVHKLKRRLETDTMEGSAQKDGNVVLRMSLASVGLDDPEFCRRRNRLIRKMIESVRNKAHYDVENCCHLRLYPDHHMLLKANEAFLPASLMERLQLSNAKEVLAMRSPSFFPTDLRRLTLVTCQELHRRAIDRGNTMAADFFENVKDAIVLHIHEARNMSGGDYDGDTAWVSTNVDLLSCLPDSIEAKPMSHVETTEKHKLEEKLWTECTMKHLIEYVRFFRDHRTRLGRLSELIDVLIDKNGFDHEDTREIGIAAFHQVDELFYDSQTVAKLLDNGKSRLWPDWKNRGGNCYKSETMLGMLFREVSEAMEKIFCEKREQQGNQSIIKVQEFLGSCSDTNAMESMEIQAQLETREYIIDRAAQWKRLEASDDRNEKFGAWQSDYCSGVRKRIIESRSSDPSRDHSKLMAAILYRHCRMLEIDDKSCKACEFVWMVCEAELLILLCPTGSYPVAPDGLRAVASRDRSKAW